MVGPVDEPPDARDRDGADRRHDQQQAPPQRDARNPHDRLTALAAALLIALPANAPAKPVRIATYDAELSRKGPGLLLRDIRQGRDAQVTAVVQVIDRARADVLVLTDIDWDAGLAALKALNARLGRPYSNLLARRPNAGAMTGLDLDGDGRLGGPGDAQGYGAFTGQGGMAILSRYPLGEPRDFSGLLWRELPGAHLPVSPDGTPFPSPGAQAAQRLSSVAHWSVPVQVGQGKSLTLLAYAATPPVFDGPEDANGLRNADETLLWQDVLTGALGTAPEGAIVLAGNANLDPADGEGDHAAIARLLAATPLSDPRPASAGGRAAAAAQGGANRGQRGDPALDTADFADAPGPGNLRVDYVLPTSDLAVTAAGVLWPGPGDPFAQTVATASRHRLVWVDLRLP